MTAFKVNGIPTVSNMGTNSSNLTWQVNQPIGIRTPTMHAQKSDRLIGSVLVLAIVDANGNSGGVLPNTFSVVGE